MPVDHVGHDPGVRGDHAPDRGGPAGGQIDPENACGKKVAVQTGTVQASDDLPARTKKCTAAGKPAIQLVTGPMMTGRLNGERLGGTTTRDQYLLGSQLARDLRRIDLYGFRDLYRTYGPRSYFYAEMVFGNSFNVRNIAAATPQVKIFAMRTPRAIAPGCFDDSSALVPLATNVVHKSHPLIRRNHRAGRFAEAERLCRDLLRTAPDHASVLHLLGLIAHARQRHDLGLDH